MAEALAAAHARDIVHRDPRPSCIFLVGGRTDQVKVLDFGIARLESGVTRVTLTGAILGTLGHMAPEQAGNSRDREVAPCVDVFSLGCVLFECLSESPAFEADHPMAVLTKLVFAEPPRLGDVLPAVPEALDVLLARMLAKNPAERLPNDGAVVEELEAAGLAGGREHHDGVGVGPDARRAADDLGRAGPGRRRARARRAGGRWADDRRDGGRRPGQGRRRTASRSVV